MRKRYNLKIWHFTHICKGGEIGDGTNIGQNCYIGSGTTVRNGITIDDKVLVGIGSNVVKNIKKGLVVAGNPARPLSEK